MARRQAPPPHRLAWAVEVLDPQPGDHILEIGCGRGVAADLICQRLESGKLLAIDRSGTAVAAARARNAAHVEAGKARFEAVSLADLDPVAAGRFDKALAVNVNLFWTRPARVELDLVARLPRPGGRLHLVYELPAGGSATRISTVLNGGLSAAGYRYRTVPAPAAPTTMYAVTAIPPAGP